MNVEDDPNTYRTPGFYDDPTVHKQSPLERLILSLFEKLKWELDDDIEITISGSQTSGIVQREAYYKKWSTPLGEVKYNRDAFIVIKNRDRDPFVPSVAPLPSQQSDNPEMIQPIETNDTNLQQGTTDYYTRACVGISFS